MTTKTVVALCAILLEPYYCKTGNEIVLILWLVDIFHAGALFLTNYENFVLDNGGYIGTEILPNQISINTVISLSRQSTSQSAL